MMHRSTLLCLLLLTLTAPVVRAADVPKAHAVALGGVTLVPLRVVATWRGLTVAVTDKGVTLARGETSLVVPRNSRTALYDGKPLTLPAPVIELHGTGYLPVRAFTEVFEGWFEYDGKAKTLTLEYTELTPLVLPIIPYPRPACARDETLAGLTPGDPLALALILWGNATGARDSNTVPHATDYTFHGDPYNGIAIIVSAERDTIRRVEIYLTNNFEDRGRLVPFLTTTGTAHGFRLWSGFPARALAHHEYVVEDEESGDWTFSAFRYGTLRVVLRRWTEGPLDDWSSIVLLPRSAPRTWLLP